MKHTLLTTILVFAFGNATAQLVATPSAGPTVTPQAATPETPSSPAKSLGEIMKETAPADPKPQAPVTPLTTIPFGSSTK